jgi:hypothetical protein
MPSHGGGHPPALGYSGGGGAPSMAKQLQRVIGLLSGGGLALAFAVLLLQTIAKPGYRPTDWLVAFEIQHEMSSIAGRTGGDILHPTMTEPEFQSVMAEAQREGAAKAEARLQEKIIALQTEQQRIVGAYTSLYQRANMIAQAGLEMEAQLQATKAQATAGAEAGNQLVATYADIGCALGMQGGCDAADKARAKIRTDIDQARTGDVGRRIKELLQENPDPAQLATGNGLPPRAMTEEEEMQEMGTR